MWNKARDIFPLADTTNRRFRDCLYKCFLIIFHVTKIQRCFSHLFQIIWRKVQQLGLVAKYIQESKFAVATPTDILELFNNIFLELPVEASDLAVYFEDTYIGRHLASSPLMSSPLFVIEMWNNHFMVQ